MQFLEQGNKWKRGHVPICVILITLNEGHNITEVVQNLSGWAQQVIILDSCSVDETVSRALEAGVEVYQKRFTGFGAQWNFALTNLPIKTPWTMKLDPDERLTDELKLSIEKAIFGETYCGYVIERRLWFMGTVLPIKQSILRIWKTGACNFTDVLVNEHPIVDGPVKSIPGYLEHMDSPNLDHWFAKQNKYTTLEAINLKTRRELPVKPNIWGSKLQRVLWLKQNFWKVPFKYLLLFLYHYFYLGAFRAGRVGWIWSHLRVGVYKHWEYKNIEISMTKALPFEVPKHSGSADQRVKFYE